MQTSSSLVETRDAAVARNPRAPSRKWIHLAALLAPLNTGCPAAERGIERIEAPVSESMASADESPPRAPLEGGAKQSAAEPQASIVSVTDSLESVMYKSVVVQLASPVGVGCRFDGYALQWPGGSKQVTLEGVRIAPGESNQRTLRVDPADGGLRHLKMANARVVARGVCSSGVSE